VFSPLAALVLGEFRRLTKSTGSDPLTEGERQVLQLVARGHTYKELGAALTISPKTAENHVRNILGKLHLSRHSDLFDTPSHPDSTSSGSGSGSTTPARPRRESERRGCGSSGSLATMDSAKPSLSHIC
jgi:DNA-binding CsgD family transcriptional regulator